MKSKIMLVLCSLVMLLFALPALAQVSSEQAYKTAGHYMVEAVPNPTFGHEWFIVALARGDYAVPDSYYETYYDNVVAEVKERKGVLHSRKYTEYSRVILALAAIGKDATNVGGYNLVEKLYDFDRVVWQGLNGPIFALIALDTWQYDAPKNSREDMVAFILSKQLQDGGFTLSGTKADPDMTAMAIQALSTYRTEPNVQRAIDKAVTALANMQRVDGYYESWGTPNAESAAQVITALASLHIDIEQDERFSKVFPAFYSFYNEADGGFKHVLAEAQANGMATEQAAYALAAYHRLINKEEKLYDMRDTKPTSASIRFTDTETHWAKQDIELAVANGLLKGYQDGTFRPNNQLTRVQATAILVRALQLTATKQAPYRDIAKFSKETQAEIAAAYEAGLLVNTTATFAPTTPISRQELAIMLSRAYTVKTNKAYHYKQLAPFTDIQGLSVEAQKAITFLYDFDIAHGSNGTFNPNGQTTRAHATKLFNNFLKAVGH